MFDFLQTIFIKITSAVASVIIAIGLVSAPAPQPAPPPQTESVVEAKQESQQLEWQKEAEEAEVKAKQDRYKKEQEVKALAEQQRLEQERQEAARIATEQKQRQIEAQALVDQRQKEIERQQELEKQRQLEQQRMAEEKERQAQAEYPYYIEKLTSTKNKLTNERAAVSSTINQLDDLLDQDKKLAFSYYQSDLAKAKRDYDRKLLELADYYAERGLTFSGARVAAEASAKADYELKIKVIESAYKRDLAMAENLYNTKKEGSGYSLAAIESKIKDVDYLIGKLQQKTLSEADKFLLNKALAY